LTTAAPPSVVDSLTDLEIVEGARHRERDEASLRARVIRRYAEDLAVRSASMKAFAAHQLRSLAPLRPDEASVVVPALMSALGDPTVEVRGEAALTLGVMGQHAVPAVERLKLVAEHDADPGVRQLARDAILKIGAIR
jgi:HEAT repeat protein